jgi:hypothetical protein
MPKTNISDILKNGNNFKLQPINLASDKAAKRFLEVSKEQSIAKSRKKVDYKIMKLIFRGNNANYFLSQHSNTVSDNLQYKKDNFFDIYK